MDVVYNLDRNKKKCSVLGTKVTKNDDSKVTKKMGTLDSFVIIQPRTDALTNGNKDSFKEPEENGIIDSPSVKKPRLDIENQDESHCDMNVPNEIIRRRKCPNPFDSSESESNDSEYGDNSADSVVEQKKILYYFNNATSEDLEQIIGCSATKSFKIIAARPYRNITELMSNKVITEKIIDGSKEVLSIKKNVSELLQKCEKISAELIRKIKPFLNNTEMTPEMSADGIFQQPKSLTNGVLKKYQLVGINWLRIIHDENLNGILADEMGLGKTIQTIAFISYLYDKGVTGPHIIIVPTSTLNNWHRELHKWCPDLNVLLYHGTQDERRQMRQEISSRNNINVLLTTYNISISSKDDRIFIKKMNFHYGIFDEAHMLKNMLSIRYQYINNFKIKRKLLLTGTPLQNNLVELISLLSFVMPAMFLTSNDGLKRIFQMSQKNGQLRTPFNDEKISQIKEMLAPFCLRRLKIQVLSQMPNKTVEVVTLPLSEEQAKLYRDYIEKVRRQRFDEKKPIAAMAAVMELRKISNHSLLVKNLYTDDILRKMSRDMLLDEDHITASQQCIFEDFSVMHDFEIHRHCLEYPHAIGKYQLDKQMLFGSNKIRYLDENLPKLIANGDRVLIFSQFLMVLDILCEMLTYRNYRYLRLDGSTSLNDRQEYIDDFNDNDDVHIFLLSTRAGGLGINLAKANTVILHDIDYNPYRDRQAEDRCHRIGQVRDVRVIKLISEDTIDQCILRISTEKLKLEQITDNIELNDGNEEEEEEDEEDGDGSRKKIGELQDTKEVDFGELLKDALGMKK